MRLLSYPSKDKFIYLLLFIFLLGLSLRLLGIEYGLPYLSHPDEARVILDTLSMGHRLSLIPARPDYALLYRYFLLATFGIYYFIGRLFGFFSSSSDFARKFLIDHSDIYLISRLISVVIGSIIGILSYVVGKRIFKEEKIGATAFIFVMFEFQLLQHSQWAIYPIVFSFFCLLAIYRMLLLIDDASKKNFYLAGLFSGLAISIQNQGVFLVPSLLLAYFLTFNIHKKQLAFSQFIKSVTGSLLFFILLSLIGNFYWFFAFAKSWAKTMELWGVTQVGFSSAPAYTYNIFSMFWWFIRELIRQDQLMGMLMVLGLLYSFLKRRYFDLICLAFIFTYLYFTSKWGFRNLHDILSLLPIMCILAARFFVESTQRFFNNKYQYLIISFLIVTPLIYEELVVDSKKIHKDTRIIAKEWIEENISSGSKIGVDWSIFSVPLKSEVPFILRNPVAQRYYAESLDLKFQKLYEEYLASEKIYKIYELMYLSDEPIWPKDMPAEVIAEARKKIVYRDLYSKFIFKDMKEIINDGVEYLIITSYAWSFFLLNDDPFKSNVFNPFIKDKAQLMYNHINYYANDKRHGLIFYLAKQGRDFYAPLLHNKCDEAILIKAFHPADNLGPDIKIFQIIRKGK